MHPAYRFDGFLQGCSIDIAGLKDANLYFQFIKFLKFWMRQQFFTWLFSSSVKAKRYFEMKGPWKLLYEVSLTTSYVVSDSFIYDICSCRIKFKLELARLALEPSFLKNNHSIQVCKITSHTRYNTVLLSTSTLDQKYKHSIFTLVLVLSF